MKIGKFTLIIISLTGLLVLATLFLGCGPGTAVQSTWFRDPNGHFNTNDVKLAQKEIPFTIVVPSYVPDILGTDYSFVITGPFENGYYKSVEVRITYTKDDRYIFIVEQNNYRVMGPIEELDPVYHDISGTRVLQEISGMAGSSGITEGLGFYWNPDDLTFEVQIFNIPEEDGVKIVESMIQQWTTQNR
jgi:hypothetical protein